MLYTFSGIAGNPWLIFCSVLFSLLLFGLLTKFLKVKNIRLSLWELSLLAFLSAHVVDLLLAVAFFPILGPYAGLFQPGRITFFASLASTGIALLWSFFAYRPRAGAQPLSFLWRILLILGMGLAICFHMFFVLPSLQQDFQMISASQKAYTTGAPQDIEAGFKYSFEKDIAYRDIAIRDHDIGKCAYIISASNRSYCLTIIQPDYFASRKECILQLSYQEPAVQRAYECLLWSDMKLTTRPDGVIECNLFSPPSAESDKLYIQTQGKIFNDVASQCK